MVGPRMSSPQIEVENRSCQTQDIGAGVLKWPPPSHSNFDDMGWVVLLKAPEPEGGSADGKEKVDQTEKDGPGARVSRKTKDGTAVGLGKPGRTC